MTAKYVITIVADTPESFEQAVESARRSIEDKSVSAHLAYYANSGFGVTMNRVDK